MNNMDACKRISMNTAFSEKYKLLPENGSRDIVSFNQKVEAGELRKVVDHDTGEITEEPFEKIAVYCNHDR